MNLVDEFGVGNRSENEARTSASTKGPTGAHYPSSNHVSHSVSNSLTSDAKKAFDQLCQAFTKVPILQHFGPERYIRAETDASKHAIGGVLSQMTNDLGQWHLVAYILRKMIPAKTQYETHNSELLPIVEAFKTWQHYLESCKYEVLILTDHNHL